MGEVISGHGSGTTSTTINDSSVLRPHKCLMGPSSAFSLPGTAWGWVWSVVILGRSTGLERGQHERSWMGLCGFLVPLVMAFCAQSLLSFRPLWGSFKHFSGQFSPFPALLGFAASLLLWPKPNAPLAQPAPGTATRGPGACCSTTSTSWT